ncbi:uncharacterized protein LOC131023435 [Salvia miltiorrhiza]|uniref:uncharacterized protein LOC131023435 n=1 Tax=Salvia miltiorrhiza TaxID=226208 RepID=UPI0025ACB104|nr:uncharacterized protein LOC131023435 [Salvia miltiorrhiza]
MLVGYETDKSIENWVWALVDDLDAFNQFPWGEYSYNLLCRNITKCKSKEKYKFFGPVWALHVWSLEIMPDFGNVVGKCVAEFAHPRCLKWKFRSRPGRKDLQSFFEKEEQERLELVPDEFEVTTMYYLSTVGIYMGHSITKAIIRMDRRARSSSSRGGGSRGRAREKRVRPPTTSSSSSSGDHSNRPVDRAYLDATVRRMEEAHEERLKRHSESIEARVKRTLKEFLVELKGFLSCKSVQARDVHSPAPRPTPASEARHFDDIRDEGAEEGDDIRDKGAEEGDVPRDDNVTQSPYVPQFTQFECGSTSFLGTDAEIPHFSNPIDQMRACFDYMGEEMVSFGEPSQRIETAVLPRRSTRQRFPSQQLESPYAASGGRK